MSEKPTQLDATNRVELFLEYCEQLTDHPFFKWAQTTPRVTHSFSFQASGDVSKVNFDEFHLESYALRLRQFVSRSELFYVTKLREAAKKLWDIDDALERTCQEIVEELERPYPETGLTALKPDGQPATEGLTFRQLLESFLYTGRAHSERLATAIPSEHTAGWRGAHVSTRAHLSAVVAAQATRITQLVMNLRRAIYERWLAVGQPRGVAALTEFDERVQRSASAPSVLASMACDLVIRDGGRRLHHTVSISSTAPATRAVVRFMLDGHTLFSDTALEFGGVARYLVGRPPRLWAARLKENEGNLAAWDTDILRQLSGAEANLVKTAVLTYVQVGHLLGTERGKEADGLLADDILVDYTGAPGRQPYLYFLPSADSKIDAEAVNRLKRIGLLGTFTLRDSKQAVVVELPFTPIVVPTELEDTIGPAGKTWKRIRALMQRAVKSAVAGMPKEG